MRRGARALPWLGCLLSGAAMSASLVPAAPAALGWLAAVPLLLALRGARSALRSQLLAFAAGLVFWALHVSWITSVGGVNTANLGLALVVLAAVFSSFGLLAYFGSRAAPGTRWVVIAAAWVVAEFLRLHLGFASMPWGSLAYSQIEFAPLMQVASVAGLYGVGFILIALAAGLSELSQCLRQQRWPVGWKRLEVAAPLLLFVVTCAWGEARLDPPNAAGTRVAVIQAGVYDPAVDARSTRRDVLEGYREHTLLALRDDADLVIWPASSVPGRLPFDTGLVHWLAQLAREVERPLLVGSSAQQKTRPALREAATANSAFLIDAGGEIVDRYDKIRLVPFNEYVPLRRYVSWPSWASGELVDAKAGNRRTVFEAVGARFAVLICWENLFARDFRRQMAEGVDFVVSMTNEAFTRDRGARHQMLTMNRFRAVENGVPVVRTATTGISAVIDPAGRMLATVVDANGEAHESYGQLVVSLPRPRPATLYSRFGDWLPVLCGAWLAALAFRLWLRPLESRTS